VQQEQWHTVVAPVDFVIDLDAVHRRVTALHRRDSVTL
jgi:hypothetical protein